jgi:hypothetical protein
MAMSNNKDNYNNVDAELQDELLRKVERDYIPSTAAPMLNEILSAQTNINMQNMASTVESEEDDDKVHLLNYAQVEHVAAAEKSAIAHWAS